MENQPVDILANIKELFGAITGSVLALFPVIVVVLTFIFLAILGILMFLFSGSSSFQFN